jgi:hypothetical protein
VTIVEAEFSAGKFKVSGCDGPSRECLVDGRIPFGVIDEVPRSFLKSIDVSFKGKTHSLDTSGMYNAWGSRKPAMSGIRYFGGACSDAGNCEFRGVFGDGAASFAAEWKIVSGRPVRTLLTDSSDVVDLFLKNIDPPRFD